MYKLYIISNIHILQLNMNDFVLMLCCVLSDPAVTNDLKRNCLHHAFVEEATGEVVEALLSAMMSLNEERYNSQWNPLFALLRCVWGFLCSGHCS